MRNVAVIAHVDHGKTTLVDKLLRHSGMEIASERSMDRNPLEKERGITILSKCTSFEWKGHRVNIVDTPGHADFGGEVERIMSMVDGVMLVVDAREGPMPQTKFVLSKALARGLRPIVVFNKVDREDARIGPVEGEIFDLMVALEAKDEQLDFPILYASARDGWATEDPKLSQRVDMKPLLDAIVAHVPPPSVLGGPSDPLRMLVTQMDMDPFLGKQVLGRIASGSVRLGDPLVTRNRLGERVEEGRVLKILLHQGMETVPIEYAEAGDIVQIAGLAAARPTDTVCAPSVTENLPADPIDPPTISMVFGVNDSPLGGKEGSSVTSQAIARRLEKEAMTNVAISVASAPKEEGMPDATEIFGRGELQLAVLIETMRREGFELSVSPPRVVFQIDPKTKEKLEPYEEVSLDVEEGQTGEMIEKMAQRNAELKDVHQHGGRAKLVFHGPSRALIGFQSEFRTHTRGGGVMHRCFSHYGPFVKEVRMVSRGALVSTAAGKATAYALESLEARGLLFVGPQTDVYTGMVIGENSRNEDLDVNPVKAKKLTNVRASSAEELVHLTPPKIFSLEEAITYIAEDELLEVTPSSIRIRKKILDPAQRKVARRSGK